MVRFEGVKRITQAHRPRDLARGGINAGCRKGNAVVAAAATLAAAAAAGQDDFITNPGGKTVTSSTPRAYCILPCLLYNQRAFGAAAEATVGYRLR
jgi:hypothetical protein